MKLARPAWDFPRSPTAARHMVATGEAHGVAVTAGLAGTGVRPEDLAADVEIRADQELAIARNLVALTRLDQVTLGLETGLRYNLTSMGILGFALLASLRVRDAVELSLRYATLSSTFHTFDMREHGEAAEIVMGDADIPDDIRHFLAARDAAAVLHILPTLFGDLAMTIEAEADLRLPESAFTFDTPAPNLKLTLGATSNRIVFPSDVLSASMPAADRLTAEACIAQCEALLERRHSRSGAAGLVRAELLREPGHLPSMSETAARMAITERTLHRQLQAEQSSFRDLVAEVRQALAAELLDAGLTVESVAQRLGYAEASSFIHAYRRWHGTSPGQHRRTAIRT